MTAARSHGPLPVLLVGLTVVTGLVDAFSYLSLRHVFVANMTGDVGFGLAGARNVSIVAGLLAIVVFTVGVVVGGRWALRQPPHRGHLLAVVAAIRSTPHTWRPLTRGCASWAAPITRRSPRPARQNARSGR
jgi:uncharacterized membrane protein YoaK (UPF0700 family)